MLFVNHSLKLVSVVYSLFECCSVNFPLNIFSLDNHLRFCDCFYSQLFNTSPFCLSSVISTQSCRSFYSFILLLR